MIHSSEFHLLATPHDAELAVVVGLPALSPDGNTCSGCGGAVGATHGKFIPIIAALDDEHNWWLCLTCTFPARHLGTRLTS